MLLCSVNESPGCVGYEYLVLPYVFEATIFFIIDDLDSPSRRIRRNVKYIPVGSLHRSTKLFGFPRFNLRLAGFSTR